MPGNYIALIVIVGVWLICLVVLGILAYAYQKKHVAYTDMRKEYEDKFAKLEKAKDIKKLMLPIKTNIKLPASESFYDIEHNVSCFIHEKKKHRSTKKTNQRMKRREMMEDYKDYYGMVSLRDVFSLRRAKNKMKYPDLKGDLYVTNKRILVKEQKDIEEIKLSEVVSCNPTIVYADKQFFAGFAVETQYDIYQFINDDPTVIIIIRELIKKNK